MLAENICNLYPDEVPHAAEVLRNDSSGGRFAIFGIFGAITWSYDPLTDSMKCDTTASCEVLSLDGDERWESLLPMPRKRTRFVCAAVGGCVIVTGGEIATDVYEEEAKRWRTLPHDLPRDIFLRIHTIVSSFVYIVYDSALKKARRNPKGSTGEPEWVFCFALVITGRLL